MELVLWSIFWILIAFGFVGCFISRFPGPVLAFCGILIAKLFMSVGELISWWNVILIGLLVIASVILNRFIPKWSQSIAEFGKAGNYGALVGSLLTFCIAPALSEIRPVGVGISVMILSFILLPFIFATLFEYTKQKDILEASKSGGSATFVYICTTFVKLFTVVYTVYLMFVNN
ncbi:MAG: DUF456 family protein [Muribaculaceae bacterium]|nr:DUF456 family protein [Muribaculaceae bacterium]